MSAKSPRATATPSRSPSRNGKSHSSTSSTSTGFALADAVKRNLWLLADPTFIFAFQCLACVLFLKGDEEKMALTLKAPRMAEVVSHFTDPAVAVGAAAAFAVLYLTRSVKVQPEGFERLRLGWYFWNATIFHITMDGMVNLGYLPIMEENYQLLDLRFKKVGVKPHSPSRGEVNSVLAITLIELFVMSVLCYLAFYGIRMKTAWSHEAEIVLNVVHIFGTLFFIIPPILENCRPLVPIGKEGCFPGFSLYELFFFWFATGMNLVWIVVPGYFLKQAIKDNIRIKKRK